MKLCSQMFQRAAQMLLLFGSLEGWSVLEGVCGVDKVLHNNIFKHHLLIIAASQLGYKCGLIVSYLATCLMSMSSEGCAGDCQSKGIKALANAVLDPVTLFLCWVIIHFHYNFIHKWQNDRLLIMFHIFSVIKKHLKAKMGQNLMCTLMLVLKMNDSYSWRSFYFYWSKDQSTSTSAHESKSISGAMHHLSFTQLYRRSILLWEHE